MLEWFLLAMRVEICADILVSSKGPGRRQSQSRERLLADLHASTVMSAPAVPPAAPKHAMVASVGVLPGLFTMTKGSSPPVAFPIAAEYLYLAFW